MSYKIVDGQMLSEKFTWHETEDYSCTYRILNGEVVGHIEMYNVTKSIIKDIKEKVKAFRAKIKEMGWSHVFSYTTDDRIVRLFKDAKVVGETEHEGQVVKVLAWELK